MDLETAPEKPVVAFLQCCAHRLRGSDTRGVAFQRSALARREKPSWRNEFTADSRKGCQLKTKFVSFSSQFMFLCF